MKAIPFVSVKLLQNSKFCLFGIAVTLSALHLLLTWRISSDIDRLILNSIFWGCLLCLLWRKKDTLNLESDIFSSFFGTLLLALVLFKSISLFWFETFYLKITPLLLALSLVMLASGIKGIKQYWRELIIVVLLCIPDGPLFQMTEEVFKVTKLTVDFVVFCFWYLGFSVSRQGNYILLPNNSVYVDPACTGISTALLLLKYSFLFILMFPTDWLKKNLVFIGAVFIAFVTSSIRVALLILVVSNQEVFDYWHGSEGNQIFTTTSILIFGLFCRFLIQLDEWASLDVESDVELE